MIASNCARYCGVNREPSFEQTNSTPCCGPSAASTCAAKLGWPSCSLITLCSKFDDFVKKRIFLSGAPTATAASARKTKPRIRRMVKFCPRTAASRHRREGGDGEPVVVHQRDDFR